MQSATASHKVYGDKLFGHKIKVDSLQYVPVQIHSQKAHVK